MEIIQDRQANPPARSYTTTLFSGGTRVIADKILEESREVVEAAGQAGIEGRQHLIRETADLIYHLCVLLVHKGTGWQEVEAELAGRFGTCGLDEKEKR